MEGQPILECEDHMLIRLERLLRDPDCPRAVQGVIMPENADPVFHLPLALIRAVTAEYRRITGYTATENRYFDHCHPSWTRLPLTAKINALQKCLDQLAPVSMLQVTRMDSASRVVVLFRATMSNAEKQQCLMRAEWALRTEVDPCLRIYLESEQDKNRLRVLKGMPK
jgi:hypothetical protein